MWLRAIGQHGPDLPRAAAGRLEDKVAAVGSPAGALIAALVAGQLYNLAGSGVHDVDVVVVVGAAPAKSEELAIGSPGGIDDVALVGNVQLCGAGAVGIHQVQLGSAAAVADESDGLAGF